MRFQSLKLFGVIFSFVVSLIIAGGGYLWLTLESVELGLPVETLQQQRDFSNAIQSLSELTTSLDSLRIESSQERWEEMQVALDITYSLILRFQNNISEGDQKLSVVTAEAIATLNRVDDEFFDVTRINDKQLLAMHSRLRDVLAAFTEHYLRVNERAVYSLTDKVNQVATIRDGTLISTVLIIISLLGMFWLAWLQTKVIMLLRRTKEELKHARDEAEQANRAKSDFLASMSHEIRTPMNAILGMLYLTLKTSLNPVQYNYLNKVQSAAKSLLSIINDILDFSRIEAGKLEIEYLAFELEAVLDQLTDVVGNRAEQHGIEFLVRQGKNLPTGLIGDPVRLGQILINLCGNGVKFTEHGEVVLSISCEALGEDEAILKFCVRDSGIGINKEQQEKLFHKFSQVDQSMARRYGGTGLGLAISQQLTSLMGGKIWLDNTEPDIGSTFCFSLPFGISHKPEKGRRRLLKELIPVLKGVRALIVDDNEVAREVLRDMLEEFQFEVRTVNTGEEALAELQSPENEKGYELVLMDWKMPGMRGDEATLRIHRDASIQPKPKVIMVTAHAREEVLRVAERAGIDGFLIKPVTPSMLFDAIMVALGHDLEQIKVHREPLSTSDQISESFRGSRILLVEDNEINREFATELLVSLDIEVDHAHNGEVAVARVQQHDYDAVLMDIQMPVMDGYEATLQIRALAKQPGGEGYAKLPIIAMTAQALVDDRDRALDAGMDEYISKPVNPLQLITLLRECLGRKAADSEGETTTNDACSVFGVPNDLKNLQSLNVEQGLRRIACNEMAYRKMLSRFHEHYSNSAEGLRNLVEHEYFLEAESLCHVIKGVVGNLGADELFETIAELDELLKQEERPTEEQLRQFNSQLQQLLDDIASILPETENLGTVEEVLVDRMKLLAMLADLEKVVDDDLVAAESILQELKVLVHGSEWSESIKQIRDRFDEFDIDAAKILIKLLQERQV